MSSIYEVNTFRCRMWDMHGSQGKEPTVESCRSLIDSMRQQGQKRPVLGRVVKGDTRYDIELIYGARRLFAARQIGIDLLVEVREIDDREALVALDLENRARPDISLYERGLSYRRWLCARHFANQPDMARQLGVSAAQISRLIRYSELPKSCGTTNA